MPDTALAAALAAAKASFPHAVKGKRAEIDPALWDGYLQAKHIAAQQQAIADLYEAHIREQAQDAAILTIHGIKVATRIITVVTGASFTKDYYRRTAGESDTSTDD
jgi:transposase